MVIRHLELDHGEFYIMRCLLLITLLFVSAGFLTGCGGSDASAQSSSVVSGTAVLTFHLPDDGGQIRCPGSLTEDDKILINVTKKVGATVFRLNGTMQVRERTSSNARIFVRAMLYKDGRPDGSFNFTVEVTPGNTKIVNLGQGMMLHASL
ncbi:MAG: hypothetical protein CMJ19_07480 [Phycisphaeraceae bacterium]|nr:hypothetical protein [Phycisphaeraceae bacterium]